MAPRCRASRLERGLSVQEGGFVGPPGGGSPPRSRVPLGVLFLSAGVCSARARGPLPLPLRCREPSAVQVFSRVDQPIGSRTEPRCAPRGSGPPHLLNRKEPSARQREVSLMPMLKAQLHGGRQDRSRVFPAGGFLANKIYFPSSSLATCSSVFIFVWYNRLW